MLGPEWDPLLRVPKQAVNIPGGESTIMEVACLLLGDKNWRPPQPMKLEWETEGVGSVEVVPRAPGSGLTVRGFPLAWVDNTGKPMPNHLWLEEYDPRAPPVVGASRGVSVSVHGGAGPTPSPTPPPSGESHQEEEEGAVFRVPRSGDSPSSVICLR